MSGFSPSRSVATSAACASASAEEMTSWPVNEELRKMFRGAARECRKASTVCPYSARATSMAGVSVSARTLTPKGAQSLRAICASVEPRELEVALDGAICEDSRAAAALHGHRALVLVTPGASFSTRPVIRRSSSRYTWTSG